MEDEFRRAMARMDVALERQQVGRGRAVSLAKVMSGFAFPNQGGWSALRQNERDACLREAYNALARLQLVGGRRSSA